MTCDRAVRWLLTVVSVLIASATPVLAQGRGEPIFNPRFEEKRKDEAKSKKKIVVPSFSRNVKTMREICQAMESDGRLEDFQKVAGAQPNFSIDCPTCRPFFRIWYSSCQISGTGNLKFSPPEESTPTPVESPIVPTVTSGESGEGNSPPSDTGTPVAEGAPTPSATPELSPTAVEPPTEAPAEEAAPSEDEEGEEGEEEGGEAKPTPTPTPRPIGPERDPNIVVLDLVSRLFQNLAEVPGAELTMMAVDLFVAELRSPVGKSESTLAYFDTIAAFMLAPFEELRAEYQANLDAQKKENDEVTPEANVNEMFDF